MKYILMRHENEDRIEHIYDEIKKISNKNSRQLNHDEIAERVASVLVDTEDSYVHDEVREFVRQRNERIREQEEKARIEGYKIVRRAGPNRLLEACKRIEQLAAEYPPLTIVHNKALRTELTAKAVSRIAGGELVESSLYDGPEIWQYMKAHKEEDGLSVIVTHQPAIAGVLGENAKNCDAFLVEESEYRRGGYRATEILNPRGRRQ